MKNTIKWPILTNWSAENVAALYINRPKCIYQVPNDIFVSVIMPVKPKDVLSEKFVKAVGSILTQSYKSFELIIVIDGPSVFDSSRIIRDFNKDNRLKIYQQDTNTGVAGARNFGISKAIGNFITFQDADDESAEHRLKTLVEAIQTDSLPFVCSYINLVYYNILIFNKHAESMVDKRQRPRGFDIENWFNLFVNCYMKSPFCLISSMIDKELFTSLGEFNNYRTYSDRFFAIKLALFLIFHYDINNMIVKVPLYNWIRSRESISEIYSSIKRVEGNKILEEQRNRLFPIVQRIRDKSILNLDKEQFLQMLREL